MAAAADAATLVRTSKRRERGRQPHTLMRTGIENAANIVMRACREGCDLVRGCVCCDHAAAKSGSIESAAHMLPIILQKSVTSTQRT